MGKSLDKSLSPNWKTHWATGIESIARVPSNVGGPQRPALAGAGRERRLAELRFAEVGPLDRRGERELVEAEAVDAAVGCGLVEGGEGGGWCARGESADEVDDFVGPLGLRANRRDDIACVRIRTACGVSVVGEVRHRQDRVERVRELRVGEARPVVRVVRIPTGEGMIAPSGY